MGGKGRKGGGEEKEERGKEGKGKVASWLLGGGRPWALTLTIVINALIFQTINFLVARLKSIVTTNGINE